MIDKKVFRTLVQSNYIDIFGAFLVLGVCVYKDFLGTVYLNGEISFGNPITELVDLIRKGAYPLGIFSTIGAVFSLLSTRLLGKQKNAGNVLSIVTTVNSGANDFLFGNLSAVITYPLTFFIHILATYKWNKGLKIRAIDSFYFFLFLIGIILGYLLVYIGFSLFGEWENSALTHSIALTFGISIGANAANAFKYEETWLSWTIYNIVQLLKNVLLHNLANVAKYIFYLFNAIITLFDWKLNGDNSTITSQ